jgi:hypothetical protein
MAIVVSNDSDLLEPIRVVKTQLGKKVGLLNPQKHPSRVLLANVDFVKNIRSKALHLSQFSPTLTDHRGTFSKPPSW